MNNKSICRHLWVVQQSFTRIRFIYKELPSIVAVFDVPSLGRLGYLILFVVHETAYDEPLPGHLSAPDIVVTPGEFRIVGKTGQECQVGSAHHCRLLKLLEK